VFNFICLSVRCELKADIAYARLFIYHTVLCEIPIFLDIMPNLFVCKYKYKVRHNPGEVNLH